MRGFLNEFSLSEATSYQSLRWLHAIVTELRNANLGFVFLLNRDFFESAVFKKTFSHLVFPNPLIRAVIVKLIFSPHFFSDWKAERKSEPNEIFLLQELNELFSDDTQCEASEHKIQEHYNCVLLNSEKSRWESFHELNFQRSDGAKCLLHAIADRRTADIYLARCDGYYPDKADYPPRDCQTILIKDPERFQRTNKTERYGSRQVFQDVESHCYYYVDNLHCGLGAHLEAFDSNESHLGEANIHSADIMPGTKLKRTIKW